jgi:hypothetical protein
MCAADGTIMSSLLSHSSSSKSTGCCGAMMML